MTERNQGTGRLSGKRVLITGTGGGQGAAALEAFCREGAMVAGCDIKKGSAEANASALRESGYSAYGKTIDIANFEQAVELVDWAVDALGGLDVVYNNAGAAKFLPFSDLSPEEWRFTISNNLDIIYYITKAAWGHLGASKGCIVNCGSASGMVAEAALDQSALMAAKGGVIALTKQLAAEGGPLGIRANSISPGFIISPATKDQHSTPLGSYFKRRSFLGRLGTPEDVVPAAIYLASDESAYVTGINLPVDGGWSAGNPDMLAVIR